MFFFVVKLFRTQVKHLLGWLLLNSHEALYGLMFDYLLFSHFLVTFGFSRANSPVLPRIFDDIIMHEVFKGDVFYFVGIGHTKNYIVLCELRQDWY